MSRVEELIVLAQQGDEKAAEYLITENAALVWSVVRRFSGRGVEIEDLYQLGCLGFLKAVQGFDIGFGTQFSTYAVPKIAGEIRRFLRDDGAVKVSRSVKEQASAIKIMRSELIGTLGREPTLLELSEKTGITPEEIAYAENATASTESIHREVGEDGFSLEDILSDTESEEHLVERISLHQAIGQLPERENMVIRLRFFHGLTQERTSKVLSVSQVQVSRIEKKALQHLRELMQ